MLGYGNISISETYGVAIDTDCCNPHQYQHVEDTGGFASKRIDAYEEAQYPCD
jgi:hypothetical protein